MDACADTKGKKKRLEVLLGGRFGEGLKTLGAGASLSRFLDSVQESLPRVDAPAHDAAAAAQVEGGVQGQRGFSPGELDGVLRKAYGSEPFWKEARVREVFEELDTDGDGFLSPLEVRL